MVETEFEEEYSLMVDELVHSLNDEFFRKAFKSKSRAKGIFNNDCDTRLIIAIKKLIKETLGNVSEYGPLESCDSKGIILYRRIQEMVQ